jgi:Ca-activated chloride channel family protein
MMGIKFAQPIFLVLLALVPVIITFYIFRHNKTSPSLTVPAMMAFPGFGRTFRHWLRHVIFVFRVLLLTTIILILARPQSIDSWQDSTTEGIDIMMVLDISGSMLARDFRPDRLEAAKSVATEFISGRAYDRIGLVVFSGESFTQCPLTTDHAVLINLMRDIKSGMIEDGTAIGMGLATAVNRIKDSDAKSRVIILLTDGVNNRGSISPETAADIAQAFNIRVYTIGVGSMGTAPFPVQTPFGMEYRNMPVEIDEAILKEISAKTGGQYFRATDNNKLIQVYAEIDKLEKSRIDVREFSKKTEEYMPLAMIAVFLLIAEILLRFVFMKKLA